MTATKFEHHLTVKGWKRIPHRLATVTKIAKPKRKRKRGAAATTIDEALTFYQARKLAAARLAAAAFLASVPKDARRRRLGHYADLQQQDRQAGEERPAGTFLDPPARHHLGLPSASQPVQ